MSSFYLIKIGGSVSTNKSGRYELDRGAIIKLAEALKDCYLRLSSPLIIVFGGGSFGNVAPVEFGLADSNEGWSAVDLPMMTVVMQKMLILITSIFHGYEIPVYPIQFSAIASESGGKISVDTRLIENAASLGAIPILSGDLLLDDKYGFRVFSSDNIPVLLSNNIFLENVIYYSNVAGIKFSPDSDAILTKVDESNFEEALSLCGPSTDHDITGGMRNKVVQLSKLITSGGSCEIVHFNLIRSLKDSLDKRAWLGTRIFTSKLIANDDICESSKL